MAGLRAAERRSVSRLGGVLSDRPALAVVGRSAEVLAAATMAMNVWARTRRQGFADEAIGYRYPVVVGCPGVTA